VVWPARHDASELAARLSGDCHAVASLVSFNAPGVLQNAGIVAGGLAYLCCAADPLVALVVLATVVALSWMSLRRASIRRMLPVDVMA
jgi:ABC-type multidrug transport system fused ATPase/permease subunit